VTKFKTWFSADTHFGHPNIIKYCKRPFGNIEIMNKTLIQNWNARINKHDLVIFLGDFALKDISKIDEYLSQLNGHITFIKGNHDSNNSLNTRIEYLVINIADQEIFCTHRPEDYSSSYLINLVAHIHEKWKVRKIYHNYLVNVGVDVWKYSPVSINEILEAINEFKEGSR